MAPSANPPAPNRGGDGNNSNAVESPRAAFDSQPSDLALIETQLRPWVASGRRPAAFVHEADVYAAAPSELARARAPAVARDGERAWYFLTRLRLKSELGRGKRIARTVAAGRECGWWHGEAKQRPVADALDGGREVGWRQSFSFMVDRQGARVRTGWIMAELRLDPVLEEGTPVLCKVYRSPRHPGEPSCDVTAPAPAAAVAASLGRKGAAADGDESSGATTEEPAPHRYGEISGGGREAKGAGDEGSAETSAAAPERDGKAAEDESSSATRKRQAADDDESPDAARKRRKAEGFNRPEGDDVPAIGLHCPRCGFHLDAAQAGRVAPAKSESETGVVLAGAGEAGDSSVTRDYTFYHFL